MVCGDVRGGGGREGNRKKLCNEKTHYWQSYVYWLVHHLDS